VFLIAYRIASRRKQHDGSEANDGGPRGAGPS
jgi:hypothetical protein